MAIRRVPHYHQLKVHVSALPKEEKKKVEPPEGVSRKKIDALFEEMPEPDAQDEKPVTADKE